MLKLIIIGIIILLFVGSIISQFLSIILTIFKFSARSAYILVILSCFFFIGWFFYSSHAGISSKTFRFHACISFVQHYFPNIVITSSMMTIISIFGVIIIIFAFLYLIMSVWLLPEKENAKQEESNNSVDMVHQNGVIPGMPATTYIMGLPSENTLWGKIFGISFFAIICAILTYIAMFLFYALPKMFTQNGGFVTKSFDILPTYTLDEKFRWLDQAKQHFRYHGLDPKTIDNICNQIPLSNINTKAEFFDAISFFLHAQMIEFLNRPWYQGIVDKPISSAFFMVLGAICVYLLGSYAVDKFKQVSKNTKLILELREDTAQALVNLNKDINDTFNEFLRHVNLGKEQADTMLEMIKFQTYISNITQEQLAKLTVFQLQELQNKAILFSQLHARHKEHPLFTPEQVKEHETFLAKGNKCFNDLTEEQKTMTNAVTLKIRLTECKTNLEFHQSFKEQSPIIYNKFVLAFNSRIDPELLKNKIQPLNQIIHQAADDNAPTGFFSGLKRGAKSVWNYLNNWAVE